MQRPCQGNQTAGLSSSVLLTVLNLRKNIKEGWFPGSIYCLNNGVFHRSGSLLLFAHASSLFLYDFRRLGINEH